MINSRPQIIFIIGGPGVGKGTICKYLTSDFDNIASFSTGDILRNVIKEKKIDGWAQLETDMKDGKLIKSERVLFYLKEAILSSNKKIILIDGYPRNKENIEIWDKIMNNFVDIKAVFFFDASHDIMIKRIHGRKDGRDDDKYDDIIKKRISIFEKETKPLIEIYNKRGNLIRIDCNNNFELIYNDVKKALKNLKLI